MAALAVLVFLCAGMAAAEEANETELPDLTIREVYNVTEVYQGDDSFFNVTIQNLGDEAYLARTSGTLEVYGYIDKGTSVAGKTTVFFDIYRRANATVNLKITFPTVGNHTLKVVLDPSGLVEETDEDNNQATANVTVLEANENRPPEADGGNDRVGYLNEALLFSGRYSEDPDGDALTYRWTFGDGAEGTGMVTEHVYLFEGQYGASLLVSDGEKVDIDSFTVTIVKAPVNHPPEAVITVTTDEVEAGADLTLDGRSSRDPDLDTLRYDWDFDATDGVDDWVRGNIVTTSWDDAGVYVVTLSVTDGRETDTATVTITVLQPPPPNKEPQANAGDDVTVRVGKSVLLRGEGSDQDGHIVSWEWDVDNDGVFDTFSDVNGTLEQSFDEPGLHTLWLRVTDNRGGTSKDSIVVIVEKKKEGGDDSPGPAAIAAIIALTILFIHMRHGPWNRAPGGGTEIEKDELTIK